MISTRSTTSTKSRAPFQDQPPSPVTRSRRGSRRAAAVAVPLALAGVLGTTTAPAAESAQSTRPAPARMTHSAQSAPARTAHQDGCRGHGVDDSALIRYESDIMIDAPMSTVWKLQTDVERWPSWQPPVTSSERLDTGPLRRGSRFHWTTPAPATPTTPATTLGITSTVQEIRQGHCVLWRGPAVGEGLRIDEGVHLWTFTKVGGGVHVHTEETWTGSQVEADVPTATAALGWGLETWLRDLKATAEGRS